MPFFRKRNIFLTHLFCKRNGSRKIQNVYALCNWLLQKKIHRCITLLRKTRKCQRFKNHIAL